MFLRRTLLSSILLFLLLFASLIVVAQSQSFKLENFARIEIDEEAIEAAAQTLISNHGAQVIIYAVVSGDASDFTERLQSDNYIFTGSKVRSTTIAIYIATEEQYSEIRWGSDFDIDGSAVRRDALNPALRDRDFTKAFIEALSTINDQVSNPFRGIASFISGLFAIPELWFLVGFFLLLMFLKWAGIISGDGSDSSDNSSWSSSSNSSSWSSSDSSSSSDSGGGSDGGSWND